MDLQCGGAMLTTKYNGGLNKPSVLAAFFLPPGARRKAQSDTMNYSS
jgi:hypothetical protein